MMVFMINIIKQEILVGKSNLTYVEPYKRIINNIRFLDFNYSNDVSPFQLRKQFKDAKIWKLKKLVAKIKL